MGTAAEKPLDGAGLAIVNQIINERLAGKATMGQVNTAISAAIAGLPDGVDSFNGRTGAVTPQAGDYSAAQVGARPNTWTPTASEVGAIPAGTVESMLAMSQAQYDALSAKNAKILYLITG